MEEAKRKVKELCDLKDQLMCCAKEAIGKGIQNVDTAEMGEVTDMIKDLCEAEEKCWKACYYHQIVEAMHKAEEEEKMHGGRMGYDNWRYSSGRFAPTGRGHYDPAGYTPNEDGQIPWMHDEHMRDGWDDTMGYSSGSSGRGSSGSSGSSGNSGSMSGRMGYSGSPRGERYERYYQARMGYHDAKDPASKQHMEETTREYVVDIADSMKEIWKDADPAMRKEIKNKLVAITSEMN